MKKTFLLIIVSCLLPVAVFAQESFAPTEYELLVPLPGIETTEGSGKTTAAAYIPGLFALIIGIAGVLAVIKIIFGGIQYMSTDAFTGKSEAKATIQNALWGLLLAVSAWLILNTINPDLVNFDLNITPQKIQTPTTPPGGGGAAGSGPGHLTLTQQQAMNQLTGAGISIAGPIQLAGIRQIIVDEITNLKNICNCNVTVTSATGGEHASGICSHANGYKVDLRSTGSGTALTNYITQNYEEVFVRSDGTRVFKAPSGALYALESSHWDVVRCA